MRRLQDRCERMGVADNHVLPLLRRFRTQILVDRLKFEVLTGFEQEREQQRVVYPKLLEPGLDVADFLGTHARFMLPENRVHE